MIELRKALLLHLRSIHPRAYFQRAPGNAQFPYVVFRMETYDTGEGRQLVTLDVDGWDKPEGGDTTALEQMMAALNAGLNKHVVANMHSAIHGYLSPVGIVHVDVASDKQFACVFFLDRKVPLTDEDPQIHRRRYSYQGRLFERGV